MKAWKVNLYVIWTSQIISLMSFSLGFPFLPFYIQEMGVTDPEKIKVYTGILSALPAITMGIMAPVWGMLADRFGKKLMILRAMFFGSLVLLSMGLAVTVNQIIILRLLQGLLTGTATAASAFIASNTPDHRLTYALGFLSSSTFIGVSTGPTLGGIISESVGYRSSFFIGAAILFIDFIVILFVLKENIEGEKSIHSLKSGLLSYRSLEKRRGRKMSEGGVKFLFSSMFSVLSFTISMMLIVLLIMRLARSVFNPYIPLLVQEKTHLISGSSRTTGFISGFAGLMTALSAITLSRIADKFDKLKVLQVFLIAGILTSCVTVLMKGLWEFALMYGLMMFAIGGIEPIIMSITSGSVPADKRGMIFGLQGLVGCIGWALAPVIGSYVSIHYSIIAIIAVIPILLFIAIITVALARRNNNIKGMA